VPARSESYRHRGCAALVKERLFNGPVADLKFFVFDSTYNARPAQ
jgi:hypothetical protein